MTLLLILLGIIAVSVVATGLLIDWIDRKNWPDGFPPGSMWG